MNKAHYLLIAAEEWHSKFMVAADLFEKGKVLGFKHIITISYKEEEGLTLERAGKVLTAIEGMTKKGLIISFMHLANIEADGKVTFNDGTIKPYWNKEVRIISTGTQWYMLHNFVKWLGFQVKTDEHLYIKAIL